MLSVFLVSVPDCSIGSQLLYRGNSPSSRAKNSLKGQKPLAAEFFHWLDSLSAPQSPCRKPLLSDVFAQNHGEDLAESPFARGIEFRAALHSPVGFVSTAKSIVAE